MTPSIILSIAIYAIATNIDNLGVCIAYGANGTRVTPAANLSIALFSGLATVLSINAGRMLSRVLPGDGSELLGGLLMLVIGGFISLKALVESANPTRDSKELWRFSIRPLGLVIQILKEPLQADRDHSHSIDLKESIALGMALAINCLASGTALGLTNLPALPTAGLVSLGSYGSTYLGWRIGKIARHRWSNRQTGVIAGLFLVLLSLFQLIT